MKAKTSKWVLIAVAIFVAFSLYTCAHNAKTTSASSSGASVDSTATQGKETSVPMPVEEDRLIKQVQNMKAKFSQASNELQESAARDERKDALSGALMGARTVDSWVGRITDLGTTKEGKAILKVEIAPGISVGTWNNTLSDVMTNSLIEKSSPVYATLMNLSKGQRIQFSGSFEPSEEDYIREMSVTIQGSMTSPDFVLHFDDIKKI